MPTPAIRTIIRFAVFLGLLFIVPGALQASVDVTLAWDPNQESTLDGYRVYCWLVNEHHNRLMVQETRDTGCRLIGFDENSDYGFVVRAFDVDGNESPDSNTVYFPPDPRQPSCIHPAENETDVNLAPTMRSSAFRAANPNDRHLRTQWRITRESDGVAVLDTTSEASLTAFSVASQVLDENTTYTWRVRYFGTQQTVSEWSPPSQFTTGSEQTDPGSDPEPTDPTPTDPTPTDPTPTDPTPTDPTPTDPTPTDPTPTDPTPTDPTPTDPTPTDPEPADPEPTDPTPTDPEPTDPEPTDPTENSVPTYNCSPDPIAPADGAVGQELALTLEASGCSIYQLFAKHDQTQWQIVRDADNAVILDRTVKNALEALVVPADLLEENTTYAWRVRFFYASGARTQWSAASRFTTIYLGPDRPVCVVPADGAMDQFLTPVLQSSAFSSSAVECEHVRSEWRIVRDADDLDVFAITSSLYLDSLDIPPLILEDDTDYRWMVRYHGSDGTVSEWSLPGRFTTGASALDSNGNGLPDDQEVGAGIDLNNDRIPDAEQGLRCVNLLGADGQMAVEILADSGVRYISALESTDLDTIGSTDSFPYELPLGMISYRLVLDDVGGLARIRIYFSEPAHQAARWVKYDLAGGWQDYTAHAVFAGDRLSVEVEFRDGGNGDADGVANGIIVDPSGIGILPSENEGPSLAAPESGSSGGGGCFISDLMNGR